MRSIVRALSGLAVLLVFVPGVARAAVIQVDPGGYAGEYRIAGGPILTGPGSADLAPGGQYTVGLRFVGDISFQVDAGGNVTSLTPDSADGIGNTLVLRNSTITVDPGGWDGPHRVLYYPMLAGVRTYSLVPGLGLTYATAVTVAGDIFFRVDAAGNALSLTPDSATASGSTLLYKNATIGVDPGTYPGLYDVLGNPLGVGARNLTVVPGLGMSWNVRLQFVGDVGFKVDTTGNLVNLAPGSADVVGTSLVLKNLTIYVDPANHALPYNLVFYPLGSGIRGFAVIPGPSLSWRIDIVGGAVSFQVLDPCEIIPETVAIGTESFDLACAPFGVCVDQDGDDYGSPGDPSCPAGADADCDDLDASSHPGAPEICDSRDNDCNGSPGAGEVDADGDQFLVCEGDCNDSQASQNPDAVELPGNAIDENCDGSLGACNLTATWRNHGQFVRCVAHEVSLLVGSGAITEEQGDQLVRAAAQSGVGGR